MKTKKSKTLRLSETQIAVLLEGVDHKLSRSSMGWSFDDGTRPLPIFYPATIRSLWKRGLLDSNFVDPRGVGPLLESHQVENLARIPQVDRDFRLLLIPQIVYIPMH